MNPTLAADAAKLMPAREVEVGSLFYLVRAGRIGEVCMRVKFNNIPLLAMFEGASRFSIDEIAPRDHAIPIDSASLQFRLSNSQPDASDTSTPGHLIISETGACMTVRLAGFGDSYQNMLLSFSDGILQNDFPSTLCAVENWQLISRAADGIETLLFDTVVPDD